MTGRLARAPGLPKSKWGSNQGGGASPSSGPHTPTTASPWMREHPQAAGRAVAGERVVRRRDQARTR